MGYPFMIEHRTNTSRLKKVLTDDTPDRPPFPNLFAIGPKAMHPRSNIIGTVYTSHPEAVIEQKWYGSFRSFVTHLPTKEWHDTSDCEYLARLLIDQAKK